MNFLQIEALERRTFLSAAHAVNSVSAVALATTDIEEDDDDDNISGNILVTWTRAASTPIDGYRVFESLDNQNYEQVGEVTGDSFVDTELDTGVTYFYRVRPYTLAGGNLTSLGTASAVTNLPTPGGELFALSDHHISFDFFDDSINVSQFKVEWTPVNEKFTSANSMFLTSQLEGGMASGILFVWATSPISIPRLNISSGRPPSSGIKVSSPFIDTIFPLSSASRM